MNRATISTLDCRDIRNYIDRCFNLVFSKICKAALGKVCGALADDVVRNGEGTNHVVEVTIKVGFGGIGIPFEIKSMSGLQ